MCYCTAVLSSPLSFPRWLEARAARLGAAVVEGVLEVHGHAGLLERLADVRFGRALAAALGLPDENDLGAVARVLRTGLKNDDERLGLTVDPAAGVVSLADGTLAPLFCVDGEHVIRLHPRRAHGERRPRTSGKAARVYGADLMKDTTAATDVERRLGAALLLAHASRPFTSAPLGQRAPGRGPRELFTLALLADLIVGEGAPPELFRLALGSATGAPFGVPLVIYDEVLRSLERLLHGPQSRSGFRLWPLLSLHDELLRLDARASRQTVAGFVRREQRFARDLRSRTVFERAPPRPLPRRPTRTTSRPLTWRPPLVRTTTGRGQRDLFAP